MVSVTKDVWEQVVMVALRLPSTVSRAISPKESPARRVRTVLKPSVLQQRNEQVDQMQKCVSMASNGSGMAG